MILFIYLLLDDWISIYFRVRTTLNFSNNRLPTEVSSNLYTMIYILSSFRISPAGLDLAMTAGISLLEGLNQQQVQLSDVERTRFTALAQQETVALAQILKGSKERQERHLMSLRSAYIQLL